MANNHTCTLHVDHDTAQEFYVIQTQASNIQLVSLVSNGTCQKIADTSYYGMNASFFNTSTNLKLLNIAYQDGKPVGSVDSTDGKSNDMGTSLIAWNGSALKYADNVTSGTSSSVPKSSGTWAQGGFGLYLCNSSWESKVAAQRGYNDDISGTSARTGILINTSTKDVYLFMCRNQITIYLLRHGMMDYAGLSENGSAGNWKAIMTDGGRSSQIRGDRFSASVVSLAVRGVAQIIALKDKT